MERTQDSGLLLSYLIIRDLLQPEVGLVDDLHAGVPIILNPHSTPFSRVWDEGVQPLLAALGRGGEIKGPVAQPLKGQWMRSF